MSNSPHRPFVPKRTPAERAAPRAAEDFRVARPFVHGQARSYQPEATGIAEEKPLGSIADFLAMDTHAPLSDRVERDSPAPIADFLAMDSPPAVSYSPISELPASADRYQASGPPAAFADYLAADTVPESAAYEAASDYELPPIEHFTDTISDSDDARQDTDANGDSMMDPFGTSTSTRHAEPDPHGWEETDWQRYDWRAAAALGDAGDPAASSAWAQTDWGNPAPAAKDSRDSAARAIADALDGIARRIRDGDLIIPPLPAAVPDPATIAATLAAMLGVRR